MNNEYHKKSIMRRIDHTKLFLEPPGKNYKGLQIDRESISYITTPRNAITVSWIIRSNLDAIGVKDLSTITIFDGTSGVGGDTIVFGHIYGHVIGCEIDSKRFKMLENNVNMYDLRNVTLVNDNCLKLMFDINYFDVVYLDPPWGGRDYKHQQNLTLTIGDKSVETIVNELISDASRSDPKLIVLKLPKNYDLQYLYEQTRSGSYELYMYELEKMMIMVYRKSHNKIHASSGIGDIGVGDGTDNTGSAGVVPASTVSASTVSASTASGVQLPVRVPVSVVSSVASVASVASAESSVS